MTTPSVSAFKKAMQTLTTTLVKAESADPASPEFAALKEQGLVQLEQLLTMHAVMTASPEQPARKHEGWFEQTITRARSVFGVSVP